MGLYNFIEICLTVYTQDRRQQTPRLVDPVELRDQERSKSNIYIAHSLPPKFDSLIKEEQPVSHVV